MPFTYRLFPMSFLKVPLAYWLLITLLVLNSGPAYAEWMAVGESDLGTTAYADSTTIRREGDLAKMWVLFDFKTAVQKKQGGSYWSAKAHMDYDCTEQRYEGLAVMYFSGNMGNGNVLVGSTIKGKWLRISPGSLDHSLLKVACGKK
jgi:hypothetical protein